MTSSLVGSEMCIRDSPNKWGLQQPKQRLNFSHPPSQQQTVPFVSWNTPVSYTHLTLPTICSV
eukprot:3057372-Prorocentrum_lima.AAC.1